MMLQHISGFDEFTKSFSEQGFGRICHDMTSVLVAVSRAVWVVYEAYDFDPLVESKPVSTPEPSKMISFIGLLETTCEHFEDIGLGVATSNKCAGAGVDFFSGDLFDLLA
eukprot:8037155-Ditylum_brightwellii.AAC.1